MTQPSPQLNGMSGSHKALLGVHAALNPKLREALRSYVQFDQPLDAYNQLSEAAKSIDQPRRQFIKADTGLSRTSSEWVRAGRLREEVPVHCCIMDEFVCDRAQEEIQPPLLRIVLAAIDVLRGSAQQTDAFERLRPILDKLVKRDVSGKDRDGAVQGVYFALQRAAAKPAEDGYREFRHLGGTDYHLGLDQYEDYACYSWLEEWDGETVSAIETRIVVKYPRPLKDVALAVLPQNWRWCNPFVHDMKRVQDRDLPRDHLNCPGATPNDLGPSVDYSHWCGVYKETVGSSSGWFRDTYLSFSWDTSTEQACLRYELIPPLEHDRPDLIKHDGLIRVNWGQHDGTYVVYTRKNVLFKKGVEGGSTLARYINELGWLDAPIHMFTDRPDIIKNLQPDPQ